MELAQQRRGRSGTVVANKWRIENLIARGGMATVYSAVHANNGYRVAIKILSGAAARNAEARARFLKEGYYANAVDHEGVVNVIDDGLTDDGAPYVIMELLHGETLEEKRVRDGNTIALDEAAQIVLGVADILAAAHDAGLVHRDVKPGNVFLTKSGQVKLLDFGVAGMSQLADDQSLTGHGCGTPTYMAPEQITGAAIDARADVFALGAMFFRIATGRFPFVADRPEAYLTACLSTSPLRLDDVLPNVSRDLADVIASALSSRPDDRYPDARAFALALNDALDPAMSEVTEETFALPTRPRHIVEPESVHTALMIARPSPSTPAPVLATPPPSNPPHASAHPSSPPMPFGPPPMPSLPGTIPSSPPSGPLSYPREHRDPRRLAPTVSTYVPPRTGKAQIAIICALLTISVAAFVGAILMLPSASAKHGVPTLEIKRDAKLTIR